MAFHLHLINPPLDFVSAATRAPQPNVSVHSPVAPQLVLRWELADDGRPRAKWIRY